MANRSKHRHGGPFRISPRNPSTPRSLALSAKLSETLRHDMGVWKTRLRTLAHERSNGDCESCPERLRFDGADVGTLESSKGLSGKVVEAARLHRRPPLAKAGKRQRVVADSADVMLRLPDTPALDTRA